MLDKNQIDDVLYYNYDNNNYNISIINSMDITNNKLDIFQYIMNGYIFNKFFPWVLLILILNKGRLKRPVIFILVAHWFLKGTGIALKNSIYFNPKEEGKYTKNWYILSISQAFYICGEIVGDWYPLLRTKAVTGKKEALKKVYSSCIGFNFTKVLLILRYFILPVDFRYSDVSNQSSQTYSIIIYYCLYTIIFMASFVYDLTVILTLRKKVFNSKDVEMDKNDFLDRFKKMSEYRIFITMAGSLMILPFLVSLLFIRKENCLSENSTCINEPLDYIIGWFSYLIRDINYNMIYIDQILLKFYAERCNSRYSMESNSSFNTINIGLNDNRRFSDNEISIDIYKTPSYKKEENRDSSTTLTYPSMYSPTTTLTNPSMYSPTTTLTNPSMYSPTTTLTYPSMYSPISHESSINRNADVTLNNSIDSIDITLYKI